MIRKNELAKNAMFDLKELDNELVIFDLITNGIVVTDENSTIVYANPAYEKITGYTIEEVKGKNPGMLHSGRHDKNFYQLMWRSIIEKGYWEGEIWNRRKSGEIYPEILTITKLKKKKTDGFFYIGIFSDITFMQHDTQKKLYLAFYDPLTELPNRNLFLDRIKKNMEFKENSEKKAFAVFYMDLDRFKAVNDNYGHCVGDSLLALVGKRLALITRAGDTIARIGGDEFAVIMTSDCNQETALHFAKRIISHIEEPFIIDNVHVSISISVGICFYPSDADTLETLLTYADRAMYKAKKTGTKIEFYHASGTSVNAT